MSFDVVIGYLKIAKLSLTFYLITSGLIEQFFLFSKVFDWIPEEYTAETVHPDIKDSWSDRDSYFIQIKCDGDVSLIETGAFVTKVYLKSWILGLFNK